MPQSRYDASLPQARISIFAFTMFTLAHPSSRLLIPARSLHLNTAPMGWNLTDQNYMRVIDNYTARIYYLQPANRNPWE